MNRSNVNTTVAAMVALGVVLSGCGGGDDDDNAAPKPPGFDESAGSIDAEGGLFDDTDADRLGDTAEATAEASASASADSTFVPADMEATVAASAPAEESASAESTGGLFDTDAESNTTDRSRLDDNTFQDYGYRQFIAAADDPFSTFALDVDTGSYSIARQWIAEGALPPTESVRPEEYVNALTYDYRPPRHGLDISIDGGPSPFNDDNYLVRIGVQGEQVEDQDRPSVALTFVIDTSGSMDRDDRLGLVKRSLETLLDGLEDDDTVAIVTYDDNAGVVLGPTAISDRDVVLEAIDNLRPGGSTNMEAGLRAGYELAREAFREDGINRVVLASDGVANVGVVDPATLAQMISGDADRGVNLVTVGFGMGNYNDVTMEQLADQGDGFYAYVDTDDEAERVFEDQITSTLFTIAKDAKIQVEFDPTTVESYRLIGFENRGVHDSDFRNDEVDAGELGAGHQVTAIYEIELAGGVDIEDRDDLGTVYLRWVDPESGEVDEIVDDLRLRDVDPVWNDTTADFRLATVVATFADVMRDNPLAGQVEIDDLVEEVDLLADELDTREVDDLADMITAAARLR